jgi:hypothetical protein
VVDVGLGDGEILEVVIRRVKPSPTWGDRVRATAGALAQMPPEDFDDFQEIVRERQRWPYCEVLG